MPVGTSNDQELMFSRPDPVHSPHTEHGMAMGTWIARHRHMTPYANSRAWIPIVSLFQWSIPAVLLLAAWAVVPTSTRPIADTALPAQGTPELDRLVQAGRRLAMVDCIACHSVGGGRPFAGGVALDTPLGTIYSTNISPDPQAGIGRYTLDDFDRALRHGIARDGQTLHPAMPYARYASLTDAETKALYAFFMHGVEPVPDVNRPADIAWPLSMRWPLAIWRKTCAVSRCDIAR